MANSGSFISRNGEKLLLLIALGCVAIAVVTNLSRLDAEQIDKGYEGHKAKVRETIRAVSDSWPGVQPPPPIPSRETLRGPADPQYSPVEGYAKPWIINPPVAKPFGALNEIDKVAVVADVAIIGEIHLRIQHSFESFDDDKQHPMPELIRYEIRRFHTENLALINPRVEDFVLLKESVESNPNGETVFVDDDDGKALAENTVYFYMVRAKATYKLDGEDEEREHVTKWARIVSKHLKRTVHLVFLRQKLNGEYLINVVKWIKGAGKANKEWQGTLGERIGVDKDQAGPSPFETDFVLDDHIKVELRVEFTNRVDSVTIDLTSYPMKLVDDLERGLQRVYADEAEEISVRIENSEGSKDEIIRAAWAQILRQRENFHPGKLRTDDESLVLSTLRKMADGFKEKPAKLLSVSDKSLFVATCPLHEAGEAADHLWVAPLSGEAATPADRDWVVYYCPDRKKFFVLNIMLQESGLGGGNRFVTGPFEFSSEAAPASKSALRARAEAMVRIMTEQVGDRKTSANFEFGKTLLERPSEQRRNRSFEFVVVTNEKDPNEVLELAR